MKKEKILIYIAAVLATLLWGFSFVWFKQALLFYNPITIIFLRLIIATIVLNSYIRIVGKPQKISPKDYKMFLLIAFFQPLCYFLGESFGLTYVSATVGSIIISTIPLFTPIFIYLLVKEKLTIYTFIGLIVSFGGVLLLVTKDYSGVTTLKGVALLFFAVFSAISYGIVVKKLSVNYSGFTIVKWQNTIGLFFFLPIFFIFEYSHFLSVKPSIGVILTILKLAIFASAMAFILKVHVIKKIGLINSNIFANLIPVFTAVIAYFILKEPLDLKRVLGILIVICGLFVSQIPQFLKEKS